MILSISDTDQNQICCAEIGNSAGQRQRENAECQTDYTDPAIRYLALARRDLYAALLCALFGCIYEHFSFGVYSYFMLYAFSVPLVLGVLPFLSMGIRGLWSGKNGMKNMVEKGSDDTVSKERAIEWSRGACRLWHAGVAAVTVGFLFKGILDIYGTFSALTYVYWVAGAILLSGAMGWGRITCKMK